MDISRCRRRVISHALLAMVTLLPASATAGTFHANFNSGRLDAWRELQGNGRMDEEADWFTRDGALVSSSEGICEFSSTFGVGNQSWRNYEFQSRMRIERANLNAACALPSWVGMAVRCDDVDGAFTCINFGMWTFGGPWTAVHWDVFLAGGISSGDCPKPVIISEDVWYDIVIAAEGDRIVLHIDGEQTCEISVVRPEAGGIGFQARNVEVQFDDVVVTGDGLSVDAGERLVTAWADVKRDMEPTPSWTPVESR